MRSNVGAVAADISADPFGLGGNGGGQEGDGEGEFGQNFHNFRFFGGRSFVPAAVAASFWFVHSNSLHPLHRKRRKASYNYFLAWMNSGQATHQGRRGQRAAEPQPKGFNRGFHG